MKRLLLQSRRLQEQDKSSDIEQQPPSATAEIYNNKPNVLQWSKSIREEVLLFWIVDIVKFLTSYRILSDFLVFSLFSIPAYWLMMSVRPSICLSTFWLTSAFKFVLIHINQYRLDTLHGNRPWWYFLNCDLSLWPWPSLFLFKVT